VTQYPSRDLDPLRRHATRLFVDGRYLEADRLLSELAELTPEDRHQIALRRAQIGMLSDRIDQVEAQLDIAREVYGRHLYFVSLQADAAIRKGDLGAAAALLRLLGRHARAEHLEGFDGEWYRVETLSADAVTMQGGLALPLVQVSVNGHDGRFVLDTGTGDCLLDQGFALRADIEHGQLDQASFAGGRVGHWQLGRIDRLDLGGSCFRNLPAMAAPLGDAFRHGFSGTAVDGIIGSGLLRAVGGAEIDYHGARLRLGAPGLKDAEPLWIAGSHYPLTPCRVNGGPESSWFIDSGMSGIGLACSDSAAKRHGGMPLKQTVAAHGGGGALQASAVRLRDFRHADRVYPELTAAVLPDFKLGRELGIRIGGIIGHEWLARHRVRLDYRAMQVQCTPATDASRAEPRQDQRCTSNGAAD
jgi:hypothetical protein